jgi:threonine dehydrogenase-like Zn-dependent dehydrogenase
MRAAVFAGVGEICIESVPDPRIEEPGDAVVRVLAAGICGTDLWSYRGVDPLEPGSRVGHEFVGAVESVGSDVTALRPGDVVVSPFTYSDGTCPMCRQGLTTSCVAGGFWGGSPSPGGAQAEAIRVPFADATLVRLPIDAGAGHEDLRRFLPLADALPTGHHAAVGAVEPGSAVVVVGDGPVGLCAVMAARRLGAERIVAIGHHDGRLALARALGATDTALAPSSPGDAIRDLIDGGASVAMECVGTQSAIDTALACVRDGGTVSYVGLPAAGAVVPLLTTFDRNITVRGGVAPARSYIPALLEDVAAGGLDPSPILDLELTLDETARGYEAMHRREAVKAVIFP